jgi:hypothetical protein
VDSWSEDLLAPEPVLTFYDEVRFHAALGHLILEEIGLYFQCPLLPVK